MPHHAERGSRTSPALCRAICLCALLAVFSGCTHVRLMHKTIHQGSTLTDLQYDLVLDNLAMFACIPDSLAWHVRINGGVVQVTDQGSGFTGANLGGPGTVAPNLGIQTNILHQWNVDPVVESDDLETLQLAYRKAINPLDPDGSLKHEAYDKICSLSGEFHIALTRAVAFDVIETMKLRANPERLARLEEIKVDMTSLYDEIDSLSEHAQHYEQSSFWMAPQGSPTKLEFLKQEIIRLTSELGDGPVEPVSAFYRPGRNVGLVDQAQGKIEALLKLFQESDDGEPNPYSSPWLAHGCRKKDVPRCVCLVGGYKGCGNECYVWVTPENMRTFRDFVLIILALAPPDSQESSTATPGLGAANSPNF